MDQQFGPRKDGRWVFPVPEYLVMITRYHGYQLEHEADEKAKLAAKLGEMPKVSYDFEIRRSRSDEACDLLEAFVRQQLSGIDLVVDDMGRFWSNQEIAQADDFLDIYRYKKGPGVNP